MTKLVLDGALFSESVMLGTNKNGMIRIAEEMLQEFNTFSNLDISFSNTIYSRKYDVYLRKFLDEKYPTYSRKVLSQPPFFSSTLSGLNMLSRYFAKYSGLEVSNSGLDKGDLFHSFYYPFPNNIIRNTTIKKSITFLDIIPLRLKGYDSTLIDRTERVVKSIIPNFAISISEFSRQDLLDYSKEVDPDHVFVAPLAASKELFFQNNNKEEWVRVKKKYGLPEKYFLCISSTDQRKNLPHLIKCFAKFYLQEKPKDLYLLLTGNTTYSYSVLDKLDIDKEVQKKIIITSQSIENEDLSIVYSNAMCFFFMSLYEGFGLPVLEAMQCGTPVVTSNGSSMPEVAGNAALMIDPSDAMALCHTMNELYTNEALRLKYSSLGIERSRDFSWKKCAHDYNELFKKIANL